VGLFGGHFGGFGLGILFCLLFRPDGESLLCQQQQRSNQENAAPGHKPSLKSNEGSIVTPDLCGCCGTHELNSEFDQTSSQKAPHKSLVPQLA